MTALALLGALAGCGLLAVASGLRPRRRRLSEVVADLEAKPLGYLERAEPGGERRSLRSSMADLGQRIDDVARRAGHPFVRPADLAILGRDERTALAALGLAAVAFGSGGLLLVPALGLAGLHLPPLSSVPAGAVGAAAGIAVAVADLRRGAERSRATFVRALGCWLELVALAQAGGMGIESALQASTGISEDPCFSRMRAVLLEAQVAARTPWDALGSLGREIGVRELEELSAVVSLAGTEGARIRATLVAKAASLRRHQLSTAEAEANATSERLFLPSIVLMLAFMVFLMYPAGVRLAHVF